MYAREPLTFTCPQCQMVFSTISQLALHRERFCVKKSTNTKLPARPVASSMSEWETRLIADKKIRQLRELKEVNRLRSKEGELHDQILLNQTSPRQPPRYQDTYHTRSLYDRRDGYADRGSAYSYPGDNQRLSNSLQKQVMQHPNGHYYYSQKIDSLRQQEQMLKKTLQKMENRVSQLYDRNARRLLPLREKRRTSYISSTDDEVYESAPEPYYRHRDNSQRRRIDELEAEVRALKRQSNISNQPSSYQLRQKPIEPDYYPEPIPTAVIPKRTIPSIPCPTKYDQRHGFTVFYDFVLGLEPDAKMCQLVVGMYDGGVEMGEPSVLPTISADLTRGDCTAVIWSRQNFPDCPPSSSINLVVELQASNSKSGHLRTKGWLSLQLFTSRNYLRSGAWKVPFVYPPINTTVPMMETLDLPQYANAALYVRVVNHIDSEKQALLSVSPGNHKHYDDPSLVNDSDSI